jgi:hypothetical protein
MDKAFFSNASLIVLMSKLLDEKNFEAVIKVFQSHFEVFARQKTPTDKEIAQELPMNTLNIVFSALLQHVRYSKIQKLYILF